MKEWWLQALESTFGGRDVVIAGAVPQAWTDTIAYLDAAGARRVMIVATEGAGVGEAPDVPTVVVTPPDGFGMMERLRWGNEMCSNPPADIRAALDEFDLAREAVVVGTFLNESSALDGRPFLAHRRPEWVALEDKTVVDDLWRRAGVNHLPSTVVPVDQAVSVAESVDRGHGTVWAADATQGYHGGAQGTRWVVDDASRDAAIVELGEIATHARVMPFVEGIPCSIHGIVLTDGVVAGRPVEMVTLRRGHDLVYAGCATFWDPPDPIRSAMRETARRVAAALIDEVDFRGTFTIDGVVDDTGFWPTELNPRFGIGLLTIARGIANLPIVLLNDLAIAGIDIGVSAADFETELVREADRHRSGGTWMAAPSVISTNVDRPLAYDDTEWAFTDDEQRVDGTLLSGSGFARCRFDPTSTPIGDSVGTRAANFWRFADLELGADIGTLTPAIPSG